MTAMQHAIDVDRVQRALVRAWVQPALADEQVVVRWADQPLPKVGTTVVMLNMPTPPSPRQVDHSDRLTTVPSSVRVIVGTPFAAGQGFRLFVNRYPFDAIATTPDSAATTPAGRNAIRDALVAAVGAGPEPVAATAGPGDGELLLAPAQPGGLVSVRARPPGLLTSTVLATEDVFDSGGSRTALLSVTVFGGATGPLSADQIAVDLVAHLAKGSIRRALNREGIGVWTISPSRDLSALSGTEIERRVQFDVRLGLRARLTDTGIPIETVELERTAAGHTRTITIPPTP